MSLHSSLKKKKISKAGNSHPGQVRASTRKQVRRAELRATPLATRRALAAEVYVIRARSGSGKVWTVANTEHLVRERELHHYR